MSPHPGGGPQRRVRPPEGSLPAIAADQRRHLQVPFGESMVLEDLPPGGVGPVVALFLAAKEGLAAFLLTERAPDVLAMVGRLTHVHRYLFVELFIYSMW